MKRILAILALSALVAGCDFSGDMTNGFRRQIWTDPDTGCQYLVWETGVSSNYALAVAPRIGSDRMPICNPVAQ